jgi:8-oxo-dGTP pyrophosphatase MutT (NUDIX family)
MNGHVYYNCKKPFLSNGIIAVKINEKDNVCEEHMFLMVKRKHTFGFIDFVRGKYSVNNKSHLLGMINEMTVGEKDKVMNLDFVSLWNYLWGNTKENEINKEQSTKISNFDNEKKHAENKLKTLKEGVYLENDNYNLKQLIEMSNTSWSDPEWEFPKGRKNMGENDIECAFREFVEETGYTYNDLVLLRNLVPYEEIFIGSNYESYKNKYFVCSFVSNNMESNMGIVLSPDETTNKPINMFDKYEISEVKWFSFSECLKHIRIYNHEKKRLLSNINNTLNKYELIS